MRIDYPDGSFMLSWQRMRAWYHADGTLKDAEYKTKHKGFPAARAVSSKHTKVRAWLAKQGKSEYNMLSSGILKRKTA